MILLIEIYLEQSSHNIYTKRKYILKQYRTTQTEMTDWQGLLKFSLKYSDGTNKSQFKQMSAEDKKFLQQAISQYCHSDLKRLHAIVEQLGQIQFGQGHQQVDKIDVLQQLQEILDSLDKGEVLYKLNGHIALLRIIFFSKISSNRCLAMQILSAANQNDTAVQNMSINCGAMEIIELITNLDKNNNDVKIKQNAMGTISTIIRGQNLQAKRIFIKIGGLQILKKVLQQKPTPRMTSKLFTLLRDLVYYDNYLHQTYKDLSAFSNTAGLKMSNDNHELTYDINADKMKENLKPENEKYRGMIAKFFIQNHEIKQKYQEWLKCQDNGKY